MSKRAALYKRLPHPLREAAAAGYGLYLNAWRYGGARTERYVEEALERDTWSPQQWRSWTDGRLAWILNRAATTVPYYRGYWEHRRREGDRASYEVLENWPLLAKENVRAHPRAFVADDCNVRWMFREHTSGSTGTPLTLWWSLDTVQRWYALFEARIRQWSGVSRHEPWAILGGRAVVPVERTSPPFWVWNGPMRQLYLSSYHLRPENAAAYVEALSRRGISHLISYPSAVYILACMALDGGLDVPRLNAVVTNAEALNANQRRAIAEAFRCEVRETYGMAEIVATASECRHGGMHLWPEVGVIEIKNNAVNEAASSPGPLVCTGLFNPDMPLIRYQVGDSGSLLPPEAQCTCGRSLPLLGGIEGRLDDVIVTPDGRYVGRLDPVFKAELSIREAQVVQCSLRELQVNIVPAEGWTCAQAEAVIEAVRARVGDVEISLCVVSSIPRTSNGKFRSVISHIGQPTADSFASI